MSIQTLSSKLVLTLGVVMLVSCGGSNSSGTSGAGTTATGFSSISENDAVDGPTATGITVDTPLLYIERSISQIAQTKSQAFIAAVQESDSAPLDLMSPYAFNPGAKLLLRTSLDVDASSRDVLAGYFGGAYDVKDLHTAADGSSVLFAAHGPEDHATDYTWNIYRYDFSSQKITRIIADAALANAGEDTAPVFADDNTIVFSSSRAAGDPDSDIDRFVRENENCYKVLPNALPSLLHRMDSNGDNIVQLTYGNSHDYKTLALKDGVVAFIRWEQDFEVLPECADWSNNLTDTSDVLHLLSASVPSGLTPSIPWQGNMLCQNTVLTPAGPAVANNRYTVMQIHIEDKSLDQLYQTVTIAAADEGYVAIDKLLQAEDGRFMGLLSHQYHLFSGGNLLMFQEPGNEGADSIYAELAPTSMIAGEVDLYPNQVSPDGWFSAATSYNDGSGRLLVSWSNCLTETNGINQFCSSGSKAEDLVARYGIWVYDKNTASRLPVVPAREDVFYSDMALARASTKADFPYDPYALSVSDNPDLSTLVCIDPGAENIAPIANAGADQQIVLGDLAQFSGALSFDANNDALSYYWSVLSAPEGATETLADANVMDITFEPLQLGDYQLQLVVNDGYLDSMADVVNLHVVAANQAPTAKIVAATQVTVGTTVALNGAQSLDPENQPLNYQWQFISRPDGSDASLNDDTTSMASFEADVAGAYQVSLIVNDGVYDSLPAVHTVQANYIFINQPPLANAGVDQRVAVAARVALTGNASADPEGAALSYTWQIVSAPALSAAALMNSRGVMPEFYPDKAGVYQIMLTVSDGVNSASDSVMVTAYQPNRTPIANAGADQQVALSAQVYVSAAASSDPDGDALTYTWRILETPADSTAQLQNSTAIEAGFVADLEGTYVLGLVVSDAEYTSAEDRVVITASYQGENRAPVANAGADQKVSIDDLVTLSGSASSDADGDTLSYSWRLISKPDDSSAVLINADSVGAQFTADSEGDYLLGLVVNDGKLASDEDLVRISAIYVGENRAPVANAGADQKVSIDDLVTLSGSASSDADGDTLSYSWRLISKPDDSSAVLINADSVGAQFTADSEGDYLLGLVVNDGKLASDEDLVRISAVYVGENRAPVANAGADQKVLVDDLVTLNGAASLDADGDMLSYRWRIITKPATSAAQLMASTSLTTGFTADVEGVYRFGLIVNDGALDSTEDEVVVTAIYQGPNRAPVANAGTNVEVALGAPVVLDGSMSQDPDGDPLTYRWLLVSPENTTVDLLGATTAAPSFISAERARLVFALTVSDGELTSEPSEVIVDVINTAPVAVAGADQLTVVGKTVTLDASQSTDADGDALTYSWVLLEKPDNSQAILSDDYAIKPTFVSDVSGDYIVQLKVNDGYVDSEFDHVRISTENRRPIANAGEDMSAQVGERYYLDGSASSDADDDPLSYSWRLVSAPEGSAAQLEDVTTVEPTIAIDVAGAYQFELVVNDGYLDSKPDMVSIYSDVNTRPVAVITGAKTINLTDVLALDGSSSYDADGDSLSYRWSLLASPDGSAVELDGTTTATPNFSADTYGDYVVQLIVDDGELVSDAVTHDIHISQEPVVCRVEDVNSRSIPITLRDFKKSHPDFEYAIGLDEDIVSEQLGDDRLPVYANTYGTTPTTNGKAFFDQWYRDVNGVNIPFAETLELTRGDSESHWYFDNSNFFPLDDVDGESVGWGQTKGFDHNFYFTLEMHMQFDYNGGEQFVFRGDDDLWVFINGVRVIDIGGVHAAVERDVNLDEVAAQIGLVAGESYTFDLFFAERHTTQSNFRFETSIDLRCVTD